MYDIIEEDEGGAVANEATANYIKGPLESFAKNWWVSN